MVSRMLRYLDGVQQFRSPYAPELKCVAARVNVPGAKNDQGAIYIMGKGNTLDEAQARLLGEAAERASVVSSAEMTVWPMWDMLTGETTDVDPRSFFAGLKMPGTQGCAAHNHWERAAVSAITELWERRAIADWWYGQAVLRPFAAELVVEAGIAEFVQNARKEAVAPRVTRLFVIDTPAPVHVIAALSTDPENGQAALGFAAGVNFLQTAERAVLELFSVELETADLFRAHLDGDQIEDGSNRARVSALQAALKTRFETEAMGETITSLEGYTQIRPAGPKDLVERSAALGRAVALVNLTDDSIGIPVWRAVFTKASENPFLDPQEGILPI